MTVAELRTILNAIPDSEADTMLVEFVEHRVCSNLVEVWGLELHAIAADDMDGLVNVYLCKHSDQAVAHITNLVS